METVLLYFLKVSAGVAAFYAFYKLVLRHQKSFRFNRVYLGSAMLLSFLIPLVTITLVQPVARQLVILPEASSGVSASGTAVSSGTDFPELLLTVCLGISGLFLLNLAAGYRKAVSIVRRCREIEISAVRVYLTGEEVHPFTFFNRIVIPEGMTAHPEIGIILKHELVHANEKHTLDILSSEILFLFQWFNPFAWLLKKAIKDNLEYLTDHEVLHHADMEMYQLAMVSLADQKGALPFLNAMNGNDLKNRIIMMKMKTENKNGMIRKLMVIPLVTLLIVGLSNREFKAAPVSGGNPALSQTLPGFAHYVPDTAKGSKKEVVVVGYPADKSGNLKVTDQDQNGKAGTNQTAKWYVTKRKDSDQNRDKAGNEITVIGYGMKKEGSPFAGDSLKIRKVESGKAGQPIYVLDGKEVPGIDGISPESIESISVLKDASSTALFGERGKNGAILIQLKKQDNKSTDALIIMDGKEFGGKIAEVNPDQISMVNVLKGESATAKYGEKGKNGVVEITMKPALTETKSTLGSIPDLRKTIARTIMYPKEAVENGLQGNIRVYAYINGSGKITQITESKPQTDMVTVDEVVIVGYAAQNRESKPMNSTPILNEEAALRVKNLPDLDIPELKNRWAEFQFKFMLQ